MWPFSRNKPFKVGDIVKCIDDRNWNCSNHSLNIVYGNNYKILAVVKCPTCGYLSYDIGCRFTGVNSNNFTNCTVNSKITNHTLPFQGTHLAGYFRFQKTTEEFVNKESLKNELEKSLIAEDYETASKLRDIIEKIK